MTSNPVSGAAYLLQGIRLIARPGLRRFVMVPLLVNVVVFAGGIAAGVAWFEGFVTGLQARVPSWLHWLDWILWPLFVLLLLAVVFYGFGLVANLIAAPFNGLLAEQTERLLTGRPLSQDATPWKLLRDLVPTLIDEAKKILYALVLAIPFLFLLFLPVVGPVLWFLYTAWIFAFQYSDYPLGNHGLKLKAMRRRLKERRLTSLGFGAAVAGMGMVPVLNFIVMPAAVAGATALWLRELRVTSHHPGPHQSRVATRYLALVIDHLSGRMTGEILEGPQRGQNLDLVSTEDLLDLLERAYLSDATSAEALEVYLEHERGHALNPGRGQTRPLGPPSKRPVERGEPRPPLVCMVPEEAQAVLGIAAGASPEEVRAAHKRLMQRLHPDRGGSAYLAAKINEAKEVLLG
ncbi:MAG: sulfate transporter CysZ [Bdellovibrio bacteriovorus]